MPLVKIAYTELRGDFCSYLLDYSRTLLIMKEFGDHYAQFPLDCEALLENQEYIESLKMFSGIYHGMINETREFLERTTIIKETIEIYLNNKN